jgi:hypothetical protein
VVQAVAQTGGTNIACRGLVGTAEVRRPLGRPRCEWNNSTDVKAMGLRAWTGLVWLRIWISGGLF